MRPILVRTKHFIFLFRERTFKKHYHHGDRRQVRVEGSTDV